METRRKYCGFGRWIEQDSRTLKKYKNASYNMHEAFLVIPSGLEPETCCLEGSCSIQLSYRTKWKRNQLTRSKKREVFKKDFQTGYPQKTPFLISDFQLRAQTYKTIFKKQKNPHKIQFEIIMSTSSSSISFANHQVSIMNHSRNRPLKCPQFPLLFIRFL